MSNEQNNKGFSMIADFEGDVDELFKFDVPPEVPILPVRNLVLFPGVVAPILIGRKSSLTLINKAYEKNMIIAVMCQRSPDTDEPKQKDLYDIGVFAKVVKILAMPDKQVTVIVQGLSRCALMKV